MHVVSKFVVVQQASQCQAKQFLHCVSGLSHQYCFSTVTIQENASGYVCNPGSSKERDAVSGRRFGERLQHEPL